MKSYQFYYYSPSLSKSFVLMSCKLFSSSMMAFTSWMAFSACFFASAESDFA